MIDECQITPVRRLDVSLCYLHRQGSNFDYDFDFDFDLVYPKERTPSPLTPSTQNASFCTFSFNFFIVSQSNSSGVQIFFPADQYVTILSSQTKFFPLYAARRASKLLMTLNGSPCFWISLFINSRSFTRTTSEQRISNQFLNNSIR